MPTSVSVLMIEDSENDAELILLELRREGFAPTAMRVDTGNDLRTALSNGPWDVIISDNNMPGFSGAEALQMARTHAPHVPFIVVSGTRGEDEAVDAMRAGASDFIVKSRLHRLAPAIERELRDAEHRREQRRTEEALHESQQLLQSHDVHAAERLAGGVAHDFRNIVAAILGHANLVLGGLPADSPHRDDVEIIRRAGQEATELTRQLIAFSHHLAHRSEQPGANHERLLLIDDEPFGRELIAQILMDAGYGVARASGPDQALSMLSSESSPIHLAVLPVAMATMHGDFVRRIQLLRPSIRVLFIDNAADGGLDGDRLVEFGGLLRKPFAPADLVASVRDTLDLIKH